MESANRKPDPYKDSVLAERVGRRREWGFGSYEKRGHCAYVTLDRPEVLNALHAAHHRELAQVWADVEADHDVRVAILTGAGERAFCAGYDLTYGAAQPGQSFFELDGPAGFGGLVGRNGLAKPVIAAVNGHAVGGGLALMLACDLVVASADATIGMPEPRMGLPSGGGGLERLVRQVPTKLAMEVVLLARRVSMEHASRIGLVNTVVAATEVMSVAEEWAAEIAVSAPAAVSANLAAARRAPDLPLEIAVRQVYSELQTLWESEDFRSGEGARAFVEKRKPQWTSS